MHFEKDARTEWQDLCTTSYDLLPSGVRARNRYSGEYMLDTIRRIYSRRPVHEPRHSSQSAWRSGIPRVFPSTAMKPRKLYQGLLTVSMESSFSGQTRDRPTVNKNGHREKVDVGVCNLGSSTEMNGCKEDNTICQRLCNAHTCLCVRLSVYKS